MALEVERKYRIDAELRARVRSALETLGAVCHGTEFEVNTIYTSKGLRSNGGAVRIRTTEKRSTLTYKRRVEGGDALKTHLEHETEISDADSADALLRELGMTAALVYEKRRETWTLGDVEVVVDELPFGDFIEIEGQGDAITDSEVKLGLGNAEAVDETYPRMTARLGKPNNGIIEARFK